MVMRDMKNVPKFNAGAQVSAIRQKRRGDIMRATGWLILVGALIFTALIVATDKICGTSPIFLDPVYQCNK